MKPSRYIAACLSALISLGLWVSPWGETIENATIDFLLAHTAPHTAPSDIVIVAIDEPSFAELAMRWPWPRSVHAALLRRLLAEGAAAIALDVVFSEPSAEEEDLELTAALEAAGKRAVLGAEVNLVDDPHFTQQILVTPLPRFTAYGAATGYINLPLDDDGFVRRMSAPLGDKETLAAAGARLLREHRGEAPDKSAPDHGALIRFSGCPRTVQTVSYYQVLQGTAPPGFFRDKLVFVGVATSLEVDSQQGVSDHFLTPFSRQSGGYMAGVEIQANIAANFLSGTAIIPISNRTVSIALVLLAFLSTLLFFRVPPLKGAVTWLVAGGAGALLCFEGLLYLGTYITPWLLVLPQTVAYLTSILVQYTEIWQERNFIRRVFSTYVSPRVVERLLAEPDHLSVRGEPIEGTALFLDIVGFSLIAEQVSPQELVQIVNRCLGALSVEVFASDGMIDKFIGDCIMAVWGAPFPVEQHASRAALTALRMQERMVELSAAERKLSGATISVRIGVSSGGMVAGNVGDSAYVNYTVIGTAVNVASRLEGLCKIYGVGILISEACAEMLPEDAFELREIDVVVAKGMARATKILELQAVKGKLTEAQTELNRLFALGRSAYAAGRFVEAEEYFEQALYINPSDGPSAVFLKRAKGYVARHPDEWDGIYRAQEK